MNSSLSLHDLCFRGDINKVEEVCVTHPDHVHITTDDGDTPLHYACLGKHCGVVTVLLAHGADVNCRGSRGQTPLHCAAQGFSRRTVPLIDILVNHGADPDIYDDFGFSPADTAKTKMDNGLDQVLGLLDTAKARKYPSHHLVLRGCTEQVDKLLREHPDLVEVRDGSRDSLLHIACCAKQVRLVGTLIHFGADVNARGRRGRTPLHYAVHEGRSISVSIVSVLLVEGADRTVCDDSGLTPSEWAAIEMDEGWARTQIIELLEGRSSAGFSFRFGRK